MKAHLMFADRDFTPSILAKPGSPGVTRPMVDELRVQDLECDTLWDAMSGGDPLIRQVVSSALLDSLTDVARIEFRQQVLADCLAQRAAVRELYELAGEAITAERKIYRSVFGTSGAALLNRSVEVIGMFLGMLRRLRELAERSAPRFSSPGFTRFYAEIIGELEDVYLAEIDEHLKTLRFRDGVVISARLGEGNRPIGHVLRTPRPENRGNWLRHGMLKKPTFAFTIPDRDEAGFRALGELRDRGVDLVAAAVGESADHVLSFFLALRTELAFYLGAINLDERLRGLGATLCVPRPEAAGVVLSARELYDPCLALRMGRRVIGNDLDADGCMLIIVTGANQGGKSTFGRSLGLAQLMMQAGLGVAADSYRATVSSGVYTHYKREEDPNMTGGKFDEELARMSAIADRIGPGGLLVCNESFAATNEREGSDIAAEITRALTDAGVRIVFVTHLYDLASRYESDSTGRVLFLRADRQPDGQRSFRLRVEPPLPTSYGEDLYQRTFGEPVAS